MLFPIAELPRLDGGEASMRSSPTRLVARKEKEGSCRQRRMLGRMMAATKKVRKEKKKKADGGCSPHAALFRLRAFHLHWSSRSRW